MNQESPESGPSRTLLGTCQSLENHTLRRKFRIFYSVLCRGLAAAGRQKASPLKATDKLRESSIDLQFPSLARLFTRWREALEAKGIPPDVSLLYPWRAAPVDDRDIDAVRAAIANCAEFAITLSAIGRFPRKRVVYLKIQDNDPLRELMRAIHSAFPETPPYRGEHRDVIPHLTIAAAGDDFELDQLEKEICLRLEAHLPPSVEAQSVIVAQENFDGIWSTVAELPLLRRRILDPS